MSERTRRSSTRKQVLPDPEESNNSKSCDVETASEQTFSLEEKEREIWDEVRDENYDIIEQLPLTIHRLFTLIRQLDCQACGASCRFYLKELNGGPTWSSQTILTVYFQKSINMSNCAINSTRMGLNLLNQQRWNGVLCHSQVLPMVSQYALDIIIFVHKEQ
ncbi:hypothetical protein Ac2012v2_001574 [Leucoagaricus gongylophorus]